MTTKARYPWKRFWCPRDESINLIDGGYLLDPESDGRYANPNLKASEDLGSIPALVLLGEPGIGKSDVIQRDFRRLASAANGVSVRFEDLREYSSDSLLYQRLFHSPEIESWREGNSHLILFLDSLDEALLRVDTIASLLVAELRQWPIDRLTLRVACRTAVWPHGLLEPALFDLWGKDRVEIYELAPLRATDVALAAKMRGLDPTRFLEAIRTAGAQGFASKPLTLGMLLNLYAKNQSFGNSVIDLFERGCRTLCEEHNDSRRATPKLYGLPASHRLAIAGRLAAVTIFGNRFAIWTNPDQGDVPDADVKVDELVGGIERTPDETVSVNREALMDTLDTGLFTARGPGEMGWAHQGYAEFLAAYYLKQRNVEARTSAKLVRHPASGLVPQLQQVAAWLAVMYPAVRHEITLIDPKAMLFSDLGAMDERDRANVVEEFLRALDERREFDLDIGLRDRYQKFKHSGLADQLRPYISDRSRNVVARRAAIDIAEACEDRASEPDLLSVALDETEDPHVRDQAVHALGRCGSETSLLRLKPVALGNAGPDPDDQLKGYALTLLWPKYVSAEDVFAALTPPKRTNLLGAYAWFLMNKLPEGLADSEMPVALRWLEKTACSERATALGRYERLGDEILLKAWRHLEFSGIAEGFARAALMRLTRHHRLFEGPGTKASEQFETEYSREVDRRHVFLENLLPFLKTKENVVSILIGGLGRADDTIWMVDKFLEAERGGQPNINLDILAEFIAHLCDLSDETQFERIYEAAEHSPMLRRKFSDLLDPIDFLSDQAVSLRRRYEERKASELKRKQYQDYRVDPPPKERIAQCLEQFEAGKLQAWRWLNRELTLEPGSRYYGSDLELDITEMPGWSNSDEKIRLQILEAGVRFLREAEPIKVSVNKISFLNLAGYRAIALLKACTPDRLVTLSPEIWRRWAPVLVSSLGADSASDRSMQCELVGIAYRHAPASIVCAVEALLRAQKRNASNQSIYSLDKLEQCWETPELRTLLVTELTKRKLAQPQLASILETLLEHKDESALRWAIRQFRSPLSANPDRRATALVAAKSAILSAPEGVWAIIWDTIQQDADFGKELFLSAASSFERNGILLNRLPAQSLGDLFIWLETYFPHVEDNEDYSEGARRLSPRDQLAHWRDNILRHLQSRGTPDSVEALRNCERVFPHLSWIRIYTVDAEREMRRNSWLPLAPAELIRLADQPNSELVDCTEALLELTLRALEKYQQSLTDHPAMTAAQLWNKQADTSFRPVDENDLSDQMQEFLRRGLVQSGIVVNREVQVSRRPGAAVGSRTDIQIDAVRKNRDGAVLDVISLVVEAKGNWNRELKTAMQTQLVDNYMQKVGADTGIYLVGWFPISKWDRIDLRRSNVPRWNPKQAKQKFDDQAAGISAKTGKLVRAVVLGCGF